MKNAKITAINGNGMFKENYKFEISLDNGDVGNMYKQEQNVIDNVPYFRKGTPFKVGDAVGYKINDKGTIKIFELNGVTGMAMYDIDTFGKKDKSTFKTFNNTNKDELIVKQTCIKAVCELRSNTSIEINDVIKDANTLFKWVMSKEEQPKDKQEQQSKTNNLPVVDINENLPF